MQRRLKPLLSAAVIFVLLAAAGYYATRERAAEAFDEKRHTRFKVQRALLRHGGIDAHAGGAEHFGDLTDAQGTRPQHVQDSDPALIDVQASRTVLEGILGYRTF